MATGVCAWMPWRRAVGMWTQVPGVALVLLMVKVGRFSGDQSNGN